MNHCLVVRFEPDTGRTQVCCPCRPRNTQDVRGEALQEPSDQTWDVLLGVFTVHVLGASLVKPAQPSKYADRPRRQLSASGSSGSLG